MIKPMLATLVVDPFDDSEWIFEIKWDGYRALAEISNNFVSLYSRYGNPFKEAFKEVYENLKQLHLRAIFDGEIVVFDDKGRVSFEMIQNYKQLGEGHLVYVIFDLLSLDGQSLMQKELIERKKMLENLNIKGENLVVIDYIEKRGISFFEKMKNYPFEGMIAKRKNSIYQPGIRSRDWLKIKVHLEQEMVIGGYTEGKGGRLGFGALLMGVYENSQFIYVGSVGTGYSDTILQNLKERLKKLEVKQSPFVNPPKGEQTWVKPLLVAQVKFQEWTKEGKMRQAVYLGLREDKNPKEVVKEVPKGER